MSTSKKFLIALQRAIHENPVRSGSADQHEVGSVVGLDMGGTDLLVHELEEKGLVKTLGIGGDISLTAAGQQAIADPGFE